MVPAPGPAHRPRTAPPPPPAVAGGAPPGVGWWQATDGQWYPPQQVAGSSGGGGGRKGWIIGALVGVAAIGGIVAFAATRGGDDADDGTDIAVGTDVADTGGDDGSDDDGGAGGLGDGGDDGDDGLDVGVVDDGMTDDGFLDDDGDDGTTVPEPSPSGPDVTGNDGEPHNNIAVAAIVDVEDWLTEIMPSVYGIEYEPISGGFFAASPDEPLPPCARSSDDIAFNAYYCSLTDVIAWDDTELFPRFFDSSGPLAIGVIMAHEFGHAIQQRVNNMSAFTVTLEHQADCFAGAWVAKIQNEGDEVFEVTPRALDAALAAFLQLGDSPGSAATDPNAHGNAFDRVNGFQDGLENGAESCATYTDDNITITELPFTDQDDLDRGGDLPLAEALELFPQDIELFWSEAWVELTGEPWVPLAGGFVPFDSETETLSCGGTPVDLLLFYCIDEDYVALDIPLVAQTLQTEIGDLAVASLVASQYGLAVQQRAGVARDVLLNNLQADCLAGVWAGSIFPRTPRVLEERSLLVLSPGDFDEAVAAVLTLGADPATHGTGFERVTAFRVGVLDGIEGCFVYDPV